MRLSVLLAAAATIFVSCHESEQSISVTKTRPLTLFDQKFAGDIRDQPPLGWRRIPPTQFRAVNFLAGPNESVQIFLGSSTGIILDNANRWLGQFGLPPAPSEEHFATIEILGKPAALVEATGKFNPGMGGKGGDNHALIGAIRASGRELVTFKMVGPADAVKALREEFMTYCTTLEKVDLHLIDASEPEQPAS